MMLRFDHRHIPPYIKINVIYPDSPFPVCEIGLICLGGVPRLHSPFPVVGLGAIRSAGLRLPAGALPQSPVVALPPRPCQGAYPLDPAPLRG